MLDSTQSRLLELPTGKIEYRRIDTDSDNHPTLVFLHEGLGCVDLWKDFPDQVAEKTGCGVFIYSRFGYGQSDPVDVPRPLTYMHDEALQYLGPILDAADIENCILIGHSDGASIASIYCGATKDDRVKKLVLLAPHFFNEQVCVDSIQQAKVAYETTDLREKLRIYHGDNVDCAFWGWNKAWLDPDFWNWNIEEYIPGIHVPVLAIQGEDDEYGTHAHFDALRKHLKTPLQTLMLPNCKHSPHRDQPNLTEKAITGFIQRE